MKGLGCEGSSHTRGTCLFSSWDHRHSSASGANYSFSPISSSMRVFGAYIKSYREGKGISSKLKIVLIVLIWITIPLSAILIIEERSIRLDHYSTFSYPHHRRALYSSQSICHRCDRVYSCPLLTYT
jgi:hypothetical protein